MRSQRRGEAIIETHLPADGYVTVDVSGFDREPAYFPRRFPSFMREPQSKNWAKTKRLQGDKNSHRLPFNQAPGANAKAQFTYNAKSMSHLDDLPKRDSNSQIQEQSETAFQTAISECGEFVVQSEDKKDYGTDYVIEARDAGVRTNVRVHVQLKGTGRKKNADGSISVSIDRTNLNYLLMQPYSIFVCFHTPSKQLSVRTADDVLREYEHSGKRWGNQTTVSVRFKDDFDDDCQRTLKEFVVACAKGARDHRLHFATQPPVNISSSPEEGEIDLPVPADQKQAEEMLAELYDRGHDRTISRSFDKFRAILGPSNDKFMLAYTAEINLGVNGRECNTSRIADGIEVILGAVNGSNFGIVPILVEIEEAPM